MEAQVGDELVVDSVHAGEEPRKGEILEVRVEDGREHYVVRWDDTGHETPFYPGPTLARAANTSGAGSGTKPGADNSRGHVFAPGA